MYIFSFYIYPSIHPSIYPTSQPPTHLSTQCSFTSLLFIPFVTLFDRPHPSCVIFNPDFVLRKYIYIHLCLFVWNAVLIDASHRHPTLWEVNRHFVSMDLPKPVIIVFTNQLYWTLYNFYLYMYKFYMCKRVCVLILNTNHWWHFRVFACIKINHVSCEPKKKNKPKTIFLHFFLLDKI